MRPFLSHVPLFWQAYGANPLKKVSEILSKFDWIARTEFAWPEMLHAPISEIENLE